MRDAAIDTHRQAARAARSRSAGAPPLDDMVGEGPVSRGAPRGVDSAAVAAQRLGGGRISRARARPAPGLVARLRARVPRVRPLKVLTVGAFGIALVGIVANAMVFQRGHHPSPLFGLGGPAEDAAQRTAAAVPPPVAPAPVENTGAIAPPAPAAPPAPVPAAAPKPAPPHHAAKPRRDEATKPAKPGVGEGAAAHPRPGHPAPAKAEGKADAVAKLLSDAGRPAKPAAGKPDAKAPAKPDGKPAADAAPHPHHRVAAAAGEAKPAAKTE